MPDLKLYIKVPTAKKGPPVHYPETDTRIILCRAWLGMVTIDKALAMRDVRHQENFGSILHAWSQVPWFTGLQAYLQTLLLWFRLRHVLFRR